MGIAVAAKLFLYNAHFKTMFSLAGSSEKGTKGEQRAGRGVRRPEEEPAPGQRGGSVCFKQEKSCI